ncbi:PIG-L deacetylase family protein [Flexivirga alba]|uniref:PIG-L deacetylase family protein n=1 Tax=Flexivirga alba TaxID=702742 RepID=A0ABW2ACX8_9MICO
MIETLGHSGATRALVVVAHPDDETFGTGSLLLHLADSGMTTAVCCASRGEAGEVRQGVTVPPGGIATLREAELRDAATLLGVSEVFLLDLLDSGMTGAAPAGSILAEPFAEVTRRVSRAVADFHPDLIVTLDGSDGHRDHARMRDAAVAVGREQGIPVWLHCLPRRLMRRWAGQLAGQDPDSPYLALADLGTTDELITERIDTTRQYERRLEGIARHRSQVSPYEALPEDLRRAFLTIEHLRRAVGVGMPSDPDRARHQHNTSTCYWDLLECRWTCHQPPSTTNAAGIRRASP